MRISKHHYAVSAILGVLTIIPAFPGTARGQVAKPIPTSKIVFAGKWTGTLRMESQDSYRGNNAKGEHKVSFAKWIIEVSRDERTVTFRPVDWRGPVGHATAAHKDDRTIGWTESVKASMSSPMTWYSSNGEKVGTGVGLRPDYDATWTMRATSSRTAVLLCESNREDAYARITDTRIMGTLTKE